MDGNVGRRAAVSMPRKTGNGPSNARDGEEIGGIAGVVGMGLMGTSISACLLAAGHSLRCIESDPAKRRTARRRLLRELQDAHARRIVKSAPEKLLKRTVVSGKMEDLKDAQVIIESTVEDLAIKRKVIAAIERSVSTRALIGSNTSAIPITELQANALRPQRIVGLHWAEPAHLTRFMEIVCGKKTSLANARRAMRLAEAWGKEPSLVRKDVRGFITNRIMYAMLREAFYLVDEGFASIEDVDRSLRNDLGYWITFAGPFRFMDLTGIPAYATVMKDLWPELSCQTEMPRLMRKTVASGARGVSNAKGFYRYTPKEARRWERRFMEFSYQIRELADKFPDNRSSIASTVARTAGKNGK